MSEQSDFARSFPIYHYNGLAKSSGKEDNRKKVTTLISIFIFLNIFVEFYIYFYFKVSKLTVSKKMADVDFTRMHFSLKSFKKANLRLLKNIQKTIGYFLTCVEILFPWLCFLSSFPSYYYLMPAMHSGKIDMPPSFLIR